MALTIQEGLKDLRVERGVTLEQLAEQTHLSKSALGSYEADAYKDISHYALRNCRKISDADCAGYFFEVKLLKQLSKNVGVAGYGEAFWRA
jgi:transcriptional regulator with XRE-family HTH domain